MVGWQGFLCSNAGHRTGFFLLINTLTGVFLLYHFCNAVIRGIMLAIYFFKMIRFAVLLKAARLRSRVQVRARAGRPEYLAVHLYLLY